jgi:hypothetical protein
MSARHGSGSVVLDKRSNVWNFFFWENGKHRSREDWTLTQYSTKKAALRAVDSQAVQQRVPDGPQVSSVIQGYRLEKIPTRTDTRRSYESWIKLHIVPKWDTVNYPSFRRGRSNYG